MIGDPRPSTRASRPLRRLLLVALVAATFAALQNAGAGGEPDREVWVVERPTEPALHDLAARSDVDVRWVERGLVVFECAPGTALPSTWRARLVATRAEDVDLGLLRAPEIARWRKSTASHPEVARFLETARGATLAAAAGEVWVLFAEPGSWPRDLVGCHGGLVLAPHDTDPRSLLDAGPPAALRPWMEAPARPLGARQRRVLAAVSADSLYAYAEQLALDELFLPADRYVFNADLDGLYAERILAAMQRMVAGIPGASVSRSAFPMRRTAADTVEAYNLVARIPGSVPGTGTWVVGGHVDATASRDATWLQRIYSGQSVSTPGAEDNASGIACVLELLRVVADGIRLGDIELAFDLEFVAFSGEEVPATGPEQGLVGSEAYVSQATAAGTTLLGCFNLDMVGYDSIPGNLQVVHNTSSLWLAEWVRDAAASLVPPTPLDLVLELDESRASDHNSFWRVNASALLAADATIDRLRRYASYHHTRDTIERVDRNKLYEVARVLLAGLVQFDTRAQTDPLLTFRPEDLELLRTVSGTDVGYIPSFHRLYPGAPLRTSLVVRSLGARYTGPVHVDLETSGTGGTDRFHDTTYAVDLPAGDRLALLVDVPIRTQDLGWRRLVADVSYPDPDSIAPDLVITQIDSFRVDVNQQSELAVTIRPNPVHGSLADAQLLFELDLPGDLVVEIYDLEGQRVSSSTRSVVPRVTTAEFALPLVPAGTAGTVGGSELASGAYVVRVLLRSTAGENLVAMKPLAVVR